MSKSRKLPKEVYVYFYWIEGAAAPFLAVYDDLVDAAENAGEKILIGTYRLESQSNYGVDKTITEL